MKRLLYIVLVGFLTSVVGCSTILTDDNQQINVRSEVPDLKVSIDGKTQEAPGIILVKKEDKNKTLKVLTESCKQSISLNKKVDPVFFINIFGGVLCSTTDYSTGKMWRYQDDVNILCP